MPGPDPDALLRRFSALPAAAALVQRLEGVGGVYVVGGAVRDLALGAAPLDLDLVVDGELEPVTELLGSPVRLHDRFETGTVVLNGFSYDFARARVETYAHPGALPTVGPATIDEDLGRRDFSVNAIALGLGGADRGRLLAVDGALQDLEHRVLRVLHGASFVDDPTRLLRLARYAARLGFTVEEHTADLAAAALAGGALNTVSGSRIGAELRLLAAEPDPVGALRALADLGIDAAIDPGFGIRTSERAQLAASALALLPPDGDPGTVALAAASLGIEGPRLTELLGRLAFPAGQRDTIVAAAGRAQVLADDLQDATTPSQVAAAARVAPPELVALAGALGPQEPARRWLQELRHVRLEIDGQDLLDAGMEPGPQLGAALARALDAKLDGRTFGRADELAIALAGAERARG